VFPQNKEVWVRSWRDWDGGHWIVRSILVPLLGAAIRLIPRVDRLMAPYTLLTQSLACGIVAVLLYGLVTYVYSLLQTPGRLLKERDELLLALAKPNDSAVPEKTLEDFFGPGLVLAAHDHKYGSFGTPQNVHLWQFKVRVNRSAKSILFQCLDPLSGATARASESAEQFLTTNRQSNWAEAIFRDPDSSRGALLTMELTSVSPLRLDEVVIRDSPMLQSPRKYLPTLSQT
jgi:hypothetical protein